MVDMLLYGLGEVIGDRPNHGKNFVSIMQPLYTIRHAAVFKVIVDGWKFWDGNIEAPFDAPFKLIFI